MVVGWSRSIGTAGLRHIAWRKKYPTIKEEFDGSVTITGRGRRRFIDFQVVIAATRFQALSERWIRSTIRRLFSWAQVSWTTQSSSGYSTTSIQGCRRTTVANTHSK